MGEPCGWVGMESVSEAMPEGPASEFSLSWAFSSSRFFRQAAFGLRLRSVCVCVCVGMRVGIGRIVLVYTNSSYNCTRMLKACFVCTVDFTSLQMSVA